MFDGGDSGMNAGAAHGESHDSITDGGVVCTVGVWVWVERIEWG